jgi:putative peptidoglycan lipid II flippase
VNAILGSIARWEAWAQKSVNRRILRAMLTIGGLAVLAKFANLAKETVVAARFGTGDELDAYLMALVFPAFGVAVAATSLNAALIPTFIRVREREGADSAIRLFGNALVFSAVTLAGVACLMAWILPPLLPLLASGFTPDKNALVRALLYILLPTLVLNGLSSNFYALLNAGERFAAASLMPIARPLGIIAAAWLITGPNKAYGLAIGTVAGFVVEFALVLGHARRVLGARSFGLIFQWAGITPELRQVISQYVPTIMASLIMSSTDLIDSAMAAKLPSGSLSALNYGGKLVGLALAIATTSIGTAVLPHFSGLISNQEWAAFKHTLRTYARLIVLASIGGVVVMVLLSEPLVRLFFHRGAFTAEDVASVSGIQAVLALQAPFYLLGALLVRAVTSFRANRLLVWAGILNVAAKAVLNLVLMKYFGLRGIAGATVVVYAVNCAFLALALRRLFHREAGASA